MRHDKSMQNYLQSWGSLQASPPQSLAFSALIKTASVVDSLTIGLLITEWSTIQYLDPRSRINCEDVVGGQCLQKLECVVSPHQKIQRCRYDDSPFARIYCFYIAGSRHGLAAVGSRREMEAVIKPAASTASRNTKIQESKGA